MSRRFRYRITAYVFGGLVFGAPMLATGVASAEQTSPSRDAARQATFSGGAPGPSCRSRPDIERMTVPAGSPVWLINKTGHSAQLRVGGARKGVVPDDSATEVVFRRGTTSVLLKPTCTLDDEATPVLITATPSASAPAQLPDSTPVPSAGGSSASVIAVTSSPPGSASGGTRTHSASRVARHRRPASTSRPRVHAPGTLRGSAVTQVASAGPGMPRDGGVGQVRVSASGTPGDQVRVVAGVPSGERKELAPGVRKLGLNSAMRKPAPAAPAPATAEVAEQVAAVASIPERGPVGPLALTAVVFVMGVGAAAIRAIVSQRANRA
ncbi:hypothetical protein ODJ79_00110 [Actinoplanes sp. KI2]|uniref:hypothetical protein n=1 Tax=Actinoplanes sp. KI2 TaxID=2983315 RepID=UPI0021D604D4|nr:hypothetical protein [Actinoplanes sp. KI2]MCU7722111.1 hypothetical protein [Actinoplanes sp. KI2]